METVKTHTKELLVIDQQIESIKTQQKELTAHTTLTPDKIMEGLQEIVAPLGEKGQEMFNNLFAQTITALLNDFNDLSLGNGFEMPPLGKGRTP